MKTGKWYNALFSGRQKKKKKKKKKKNGAQREKKTLIPYANSEGSDECVQSDLDILRRHIQQ